MNIYELVATGDSLNGHSFIARDRTLYRTVERAKAAQEDFIERCCDHTKLDCAEVTSLKVVINTRELT